MKNKKFLWMALIGVLVMGGLIFSSCKGGAHDEHKKNSDEHSGHNMTDKKVYSCPMHPEVKSDKPGECPECGMDLVEQGSADAGKDHDGHNAGRAVTESNTSGQGSHQMSKMKGAKELWHCPMHPTFTSDSKGECGICGMNLVPVDLEETGESEVEGQGIVKIPERRQQLIGVKIGTVEKRPIVRIIRTVGRIAYDPELYRAQEEYLGAISAYEKIKGSSLPEAVERSKSLVESSELRLRLLGLSRRQIQELSKRSGPETSLLMSVGRSGTVWLYADAYEYELPFIKVGQVIEATTISYPGEVFRGTVKSIDPVINPKTRSARVRAEIRNREGLLKPDMYLNARIQINEGEHLTVSESAVMDTGTRRLVFVAKGDGFFEPREVLLGEKSKDYYRVKTGLFDGEKVVTSGNFLIDSESKLKASLSALAGGHQH